MRRGTPEDSQNEFEKLEIDGVVVYAHKSLQDFDNMQIDIQNGLLGDKLVLHSAAQNSGSGCCG